jgi:radical SAM superfamily enzyme YgiQ (UPF0313 family)
MIREHDSSVPIIAGGPHPTIAAEDVLVHDDIQAVCIGEGELTLADLLDRMIKGGKRFPSPDELQAIKGLAFMAQ